MNSFPFLLPVDSENSRKTTCRNSFGLARRLPAWAAGAIAAVVTGLAFALLHDAGPGTFDGSHFLTRVLFPGVTMSLAWLLISPSFVVAAHAAAHLAIPMFFLATR